MSRIKGRLRLWWYDQSTDIRRAWGQLRAFLEAPNGQALMDVITLVSIAIIAFMLGQVSMRAERKPELIHDTTERIEHLRPQSGQVAVPLGQGNIVASRKGKRWHYVWCTGASTISDKNKRYFKTETEAEKAGFTKASNCK